MRWLPALRFPLAVFVVAASLPAHPSAVLAETRIFIIANHPDGYGVDQCLANSAECGTAAAAAYCQSKRFSGAASYRRIGRDEITGAVPVRGTCGRHGCDEFVAIECRR